MWKIILTIILTSAFFILFFEQGSFSKNKHVKNIEVSTADGFIEDTRDAFIIPAYPTQIMNRDITGNVIPIYGDIGDFVAYSSVSEYDWLHGFPHEKTQ
jgi:hypothetical protein